MTNELVKRLSTSPVIRDADEARETLCYTREVCKKDRDGCYQVLPRMWGERALGSAGGRRPGRHAMGKQDGPHPCWKAFT